DTGSPSPGAADGVAAAPPIQPMANRKKTTANTRAAAPTCMPTVPASIPVAAASRQKPTTRMSDTRLELVMVNRSLVAANAIIDGNSSKRTASMTIIHQRLSFHGPQGDLRRPRRVPGDGTVLT